MSEYSFYIQKTDKDGVASATASDKKNLETDFSGLKYLSCTGLSAVGKPKNIYTENYAESDGLRVFHPTDNEDGQIYRETTAVELSVIITGDSRRDTYNSLHTFLKSGRIFYWDTARYSKVWLILNEAVEPSDDTLSGSPKYIKATFKFTNLWGEGRKCNASGNIV